MERVFTRAAMFAVALLVATAGLGLWLGDLHGQTDPAVLRWGTVHRLSGVLAALRSCSSTAWPSPTSSARAAGAARWWRPTASIAPTSSGAAAQAGGVSVRTRRACSPWWRSWPSAAPPIRPRAGPARRDWVTPHLVGGIAWLAAIAWCFQAQLPDHPPPARSDRGGAGGRCGPCARPAGSTSTELRRRGRPSRIVRLPSGAAAPPRPPADVAVRVHGVGVRRPLHHRDPPGDREPSASAAVSSTRSWL